MPTDPTQRFSNRVEHYVRSRPGYPRAAVELMRRELGLRPDHVVADIGAGTGIFTALLLEAGSTVYAIEPNEPMRRSAEQRFAGEPRFRSLPGTAEATGLESHSVDYITAAQAFHWFKPAEARREFQRILRPGGWVVLLWNDRRDDRPPFSVEYARIVRAHNTDLDRVNHQNVTGDESGPLRELFAGPRYESRDFDNHQDLDWEGVRSRLLSSSYMPGADDPRSGAMLEELRRAFDAHQRDGTVRIEYVTRVFFGRL